MAKGDRLLNVHQQALHYASCQLFFFKRNFCVLTKVETDFCMSTGKKNFSCWMLNVFLFLHLMCFYGIFLFSSFKICAAKAVSSSHFFPILVMVTSFLYFFIFTNLNIMEVLRSTKICQLQIFLYTFHCIHSSYFYTVVDQNSVHFLRTTVEVLVFNRSADHFNGLLKQG